jgi:hypothetical protein
VYNFISQRQRRSDPLGYEIFQLFRSAVREAIAEGELFVLAGQEKVRNNTVLGPREAAFPGERVAPEILDGVIPQWDDGIWMGLLSSKLGRKRLVDQLRACLLDLEGQGIAVFRFKDLVDSIKREARRRRKAVFEQDPLGLAASAAQQDIHSQRIHGNFRPKAQFEEIDSFEKLVVCVADLIEHLENRVRTRLYLRTVWTFLRRYSAEDDPVALPSHRKLAELLRIPRERLPGLYETLGELILRCKGQFSGKIVTLGRRRPDPASGVSDG